MGNKNSILQEIIKLLQINEKSRTIFILFEKTITIFLVKYLYHRFIHDKISELDAYDNMGVEYYYIGDINKANFYHSRMMNGIIEENTDTKKWNLQMLDKVAKTKEYPNVSQYMPIFETYKKSKKEEMEFKYPHNDGIKLRK